MWNWETIDPSRSMQTGDVAKLFHNETVKQPSVFASDPPPPDATLLAREAIQNSWDASRALVTDWSDNEVRPPRFSLTFRFIEVQGPAKVALAESLGLPRLQQRVLEFDRKTLGLTDTDCLATLPDSSVPLRCL